MIYMDDALHAAAVSALRSYQYGNASTELAKDVADKLQEYSRVVPEGCTPKDAKLLREATFKLATRVQELEGVLNPLVQINSSEVTVPIRTAYITRAREVLRGTQHEQKVPDTGR